MFCMNTPKWLTGLIDFTIHFCLNLVRTIDKYYVRFRFVSVLPLNCIVISHKTAGKGQTKVDQKQCLFCTKKVVGWLTFAQSGWLVVCYGDIA